MTSAALPAEQPPRGTGPTGAATRPAHSWCVLLAEDDRDMREMIASVLAGEGYEVIEARDGSELISRLQEVATQPRGRETLAAIISDVRMPRLDGLDMLAALRCARWYTPVSLITAFATKRSIVWPTTSARSGCSTSRSRSPVCGTWCARSLRVEGECRAL